MSFLRPEAEAFLMRWSEAAAAAAAGLAGLWLVSLGGYLLGPLGAAVLILAAAWGLLSFRRMRFRRTVAAPGLVEVDEGQVGYLGPTFGGYVALRELVEVRLIDISHQRHWRLKQADGQALLIPVSAAGADLLFDAFASLPGIDLGLLAAALDAPPDSQLVWRRPAHAALT